jgi:hypothetical protein
MFYGVQTLLGDAVLVGHDPALVLVDDFKRLVHQIWRCYVVNNRSIYVIVPTGAVLLVNMGKL